MPERGREWIKEALGLDPMNWLFAKNYFFCALTPELSRAAARNGGVLHASTQAEPRSGLGLNELLAAWLHCVLQYFSRPLIQTLSRCLRCNKCAAMDLG